MGIRLSGDRGELRSGYRVARVLGAWEAERGQASEAQQWTCRAACEGALTSASVDLALRMGPIELVWPDVRLREERGAVVMEMAGRPTVTTWATGGAS